MFTRILPEKVGGFLPNRAWPTVNVTSHLSEDFPIEIPNFPGSYTQKTTAEYERTSAVNWASNETTTILSLWPRRQRLIERDRSAGSGRPTETAGVVTSLINASTVTSQACWVWVVASHWRHGSLLPVPILLISTCDVTGTAVRSRRPPTCVRPFRVTRSKWTWENAPEFIVSLEKEKLTL